MVFDEDSMLQAKSKTEDKAQSRASYSSANSEREEFELSNDSNKPVRSDNIGKYTSSKFNQYLASEGIEKQLTISGRSEQNREAEHMNQTFAERARSITLQANSQKISEQRQ